jgi:hypothetical protein
MADEVNNNNGGEGTAIPGEVTPLVQEALEQGWVPKEEFDGDPERWVDAGEFVRRGELFRKIESQSKEMKDMRKALSELAKHNSKIAEVEYKRAVADLKAQRKEALAEGDFDKVDHIEDQIDATKEAARIAQQQAIQAAIPQGVPPELQNWINKNSWYESNNEMRDYADFVGLKLGQSGMSPVEVLKEVEKRVKEQFKDKFTNPNRQRPSAVESPRAAAKVGKSDAYELTDTERSVMETLVRQKLMTKEEYVAQLKAVKEKN